MVQGMHYHVLTPVTRKGLQNSGVAIGTFLFINDDTHGAAQRSSRSSMSSQAHRGFCFDLQQVLHRSGRKVTWRPFQFPAGT